MRIRSIKPEFWRSDDIAALSWDDRLLFIGLWSYVDDNGVGRDEEKLIAADLFALDDDPRETLARVSRGLSKLFSTGLIDRYIVDGRPFLYVTGWEKHQRVDKPQKERYPRPTRDSERVARPSRGSRETVATPSRLEQGNRGTGEQVTPSLRSGVQGGDDSDAARVDRTPATVVADAPTQTTKAKRGTRLPEGWTPERSQANLKAEHDSGLTPDELSSQLERFRDHWAAQPGSKGTKLDWQATWRNWVRRAAEMAPRTRQSETDAWYARAKARASNPNPLLSLLADDTRPSDDPGRHAMPPRSA